MHMTCCSVTVIPPLLATTRCTTPNFFYQVKSMQKRSPQWAKVYSWLDNQPELATCARFIIVGHNTLATSCFVQGKACCWIERNSINAHDMLLSYFHPSTFGNCSLHHSRNLMKAPTISCVKVPQLIINWYTICEGWVRRSWGVS